MMFCSEPILTEFLIGISRQGTPIKMAINLYILQNGCDISCNHFDWSMIADWSVTFSDDWTQNPNFFLP